MSIKKIWRSGSSTSKCSLLCFANVWLQPRLICTFLSYTLSQALCFASSFQNFQASKLSKKNSYSFSIVQKAAGLHEITRRISFCASTIHNVLHEHSEIFHCKKHGLEVCKKRWNLEPTVPISWWITFFHLDFLKL